MVGWRSRRQRLETAEAERSQVKLINEDIDRPDRIVIAQIVIQPLRKQSALAAIIAHHKARHQSPRQITEESYHPRPFHTAWVKGGPSMMSAAWPPFFRPRTNPRARDHPASCQKPRTRLGEVAGA